LRCPAQPFPRLSNTIPSSRITYLSLLTYDAGSIYDNGIGHDRQNEAAILSRVIRPEKDDLPDEQAKALLGLKFEQSDLDRLHEPVVRNQDDELTPAEKEELQDYLRVSAFLDLMHAKARYSLREKN
jgi:hypothetical protein